MSIKASKLHAVLKLEGHRFKSCWENSEFLFPSIYSTVYTVPASRPGGREAGGGGGTPDLE